MLKMNNKLFFLYFLLVQLKITLGNKIEDVQKVDAIWDTSVFCNYINTLTQNVSENCIVQFSELCQHPEVLSTIWDASARFPYSGYFVSNGMDFGNFDECLSVDHKYSGGRILGKYCLAGLLIMDLAPNSSLGNMFKLSTCTPNGCSANDYNTIVQALFSSVLQMPYPGIFTEIDCTTKEDKKDFVAEDYVTIVLITFCIMLMIISTIYDLYLKRVNKKTGHPLYLAFSVYTNGRKLLQTSKYSSSNEQILIFHGMKLISMMWIVAGHGLTVVAFAPIMNINDFTTFANKYYSVYISAAGSSVDTFFWISGFLLAYHYLKLKSKPLQVHLLGIPMNILHRYLRLTPAALMLFLVNISIFGRLGTGPVYHSVYNMFQRPCKKYWWSYFLYIQNYYNYSEQDLCLPPTWYISADMQMFLISPLVLIPVAMMLQNSKSLKKCMWSLTALNVILCILPIVIKLCNRDYDNSYATHNKLVVYFIGIMMGTYMRESKARPFLGNNMGIKNASRINLTLWILDLLMLSGLLLWTKYVEVHASYEYSAIYMPCAKVVWSIGLCWMVYSSYHGYGGFVTWLLSRPIMQIGGKLTYSMYLVHTLVILHFWLVNRGRFYFSDYTSFHTWCGHFIIVTILSFFWTLAFESPLIIIEKVIFGSGKEQRKPINKKVAEDTVKDVEVAHSPNPQ